MRYHHTSHSFGDEQTYTRAKRRSDVDPNSPADANAYQPPYSNTHDSNSNTSPHQQPNKNGDPSADTVRGANSIPTRAGFVQAVVEKPEKPATATSNPATDFDADS